MNTEPLRIDTDALIVAVLERLEEADPKAWLHQQYQAIEHADRAPGRRQKAWIARAAREKAKRRAHQRAANRHRSFV
jgi:hypothetical protein